MKATKKINSPHSHFRTLIERAKQEKVDEVYQFVATPFGVVIAVINRKAK